MPSTFPSARDVAMALVTAAKLTGEDPIEIARGKKRSRARFVAIAGLKEVHNKTPFTVLGRCCGVDPKSIQSTTSVLNAMRKTYWWSEDLVDEVVGAIMGDEEEFAEDEDPVPADEPGVEPVTPHREGSAEMAAAEADEVRRWNKKAREDAQVMGLQVAFGLTATEAKLLDALCRMGAATMERLHADVYGLDPNGGPELKIIDVHICKLRKKLGDIEIETVWGSGYRLSAEARELIRTRAAQAIGDTGRAAS